MDLPLYPGRPILIPQVRFVGPQASRRVDLFLDTGAVYTLLAVGVVQEIGLNPQRASGRVPIVTANGVIKVPLVRVPSVEIGGLRVRNLPVLCHDIPELAEVSGLLGLNVLEHFITTLNYRTKILSVRSR